MSAHPSTLLKVSGFFSLVELEEDVASLLVDVGYIADEGDGYVLIAPDDPNDVRLDLPKDYEWFERVVLQSLQRIGRPPLVASLQVAFGDADGENG